MSSLSTKSQIACHASPQHLIPQIILMCQSLRLLEMVFQLKRAETNENLNFSYGSSVKYIDVLLALESFSRNCREFWSWFFLHNAVARHVYTSGMILSIDHWSCSANTFSVCSWKLFMPTISKSETWFMSFGKYSFIPISISATQTLSFVQKLMTRVWP